MRQGYLYKYLCNGKGVLRLRPLRTPDQSFAHRPMALMTKTITEEDQFLWSPDQVSPDYIRFLNELLGDDFYSTPGEIQWSKKQQKQPSLT